MGNKYTQFSFLNADTANSNGNDSNYDNNSNGNNRNSGSIKRYFSNSNLSEIPKIIQEVACEKALIK